MKAETYTQYLRRKIAEREQIRQACKIMDSICTGQRWWEIPSAETDGMLMRLKHQLRVTEGRVK